MWLFDRRMLFDWNAALSSYGLEGVMNCLEGVIEGSLSRADIFEGLLGMKAFLASMAVFWILKVTLGLTEFEVTVPCRSYIFLSIISGDFWPLWRRILLSALTV